MKDDTFYDMLMGADTVHKESPFKGRQGVSESPKQANTFLGLEMGGVDTGDSYYDNRE